MSTQTTSAPEVSGGGAAAASRAGAPAAGALLLAVFIATVFLSAFLLFLVQPLFGRMVLPLLGGSPAVWNTCMLFFQAALLGGYLYAHLSSRLDVRRQAAVHVVLLALAGALLPISLAGRVPEGGAAPIPWLLATMAITVGPPFLVLAGTGPMLQRWFAHTGHAHAVNPYQLYAASNLGSFLALLSYPAVLEPRLRLAEQSGAWAAAYAVLVAGIAACGLLVWRRASPIDSAAADSAAASTDGDSREADADRPVTARERAVWVGLALVPSSLMLGVTTYITTDLTPAPLFWVMPLALYLLTFTLVFARRQLIPHEWVVAAQPSVVAVAALLLLSSFISNPAFSIPLHLLAFFVTALVCHGELARRRPPVRHLTEFYLWVSVGGALGGVFNALVAPLIFTRTWEYPLMIAAACLARPWMKGGMTPAEHLWAALRAAGFMAAMLAVASLDAGKMSPLLYLALVSGTIALLSLGLARTPLWLAACIGGVLLYRTVQVLGEEGTLLAERSFYGHYRVIKVPDPAGGFHALYHGSTMHGAQSLEPARRHEPITYYVRRGPLGQIFTGTSEKAGRRRVAVVGLGTGTSAAYSQAGETWTYYEIDPGIERIARDTSLFTYLTDAPAEKRVVIGDARLSLREAPAGAYNLILLDAFSSDAIPTHLLTREALDLYLSKLSDDGVIAVHISNRYLDLEPVVAALARERALWARMGAGPSGQRARYESTSTWIVLARNEEALGTLAADSRWVRPRPRADVPPWTDDYSSLLSIFRW